VVVLLSISFVTSLASLLEMRVTCRRGHRARLCEAVEQLRDRAVGDAAVHREADLGRAAGRVAGGATSDCRGKRAQGVGIHFGSHEPLVAGKPQQPTSGGITTVSAQAHATTVSLASSPMRRVVQVRWRAIGAVIRTGISTLRNTW
jgi:hypothetical protein